GLRVEGEFQRGQPALKARRLRPRVEKTQAMSELEAMQSAGNRGESPLASPGGGKGGSGKLSKKKAEEARRLAEEAAAYRASLTEGVVSLDDGTELPVIDEG